MKEIINSKEKKYATKFERTYLKELGEYSINFETSYKIENPDFRNSLDANQEILFGILEAFEKNNIKIAYPTSVQFNKENK